MAYEIVVEEVAARPIAAVHARVPVGGVAAVWRPALDLVWAFLRSHEGLRTDGHNIFVYHHPLGPGEPMEGDFGVEVSRAFADEGPIVPAERTAGRAASTVHIGPPARIGDAYAAIEEWCRAHHRSLGGVSGEIYGDPGDDPGTFEVRVFLLLG